MNETQTLSPNANRRRDPVPMWIYGISIVVLCILTFQVYSALVQPGIGYGEFDTTRTANNKVLVTLAGRNVVMMVVTIMAMRSRNAMFLAYTFIMHLVRETWDMGMVPFFMGLSPDGIFTTLSFLLFIVPYVFALRMLRLAAAR